MEKSNKSFWKWCEMTPRDRHNQMRVLGWMVAWVGTWLAVSAAIKHGWIEQGPLAVVGILASLSLGIGMIFAYRRYLKEADELQRKIELEALALSVGLGLVGGFTYWLLEQAGVVADADILDLVVFIMLAYSAGVVLGQQRYGH